MEELMMEWRYRSSTICKVQRPIWRAAAKGRTHGCSDQQRDILNTLANAEPSTHGPTVETMLLRTRDAPRALHRRVRCDLAPFCEPQSCGEGTGGAGRYN